MDDRSTFFPYLAIWVVVLIALAARNWGKHPTGVGLVVGYGFQMWLLYWLGALVHSFPWAALPASDLTFLGFQQSTYGLVAFAVGALALGPVLSKSSSGSAQTHAPDPKLPSAYMMSGVISYAVLAPTIGRLPSLNAVTAVGQQLVVAGCCLGCWQAWLQRSRRNFFTWMGMSMCLPAITIVVQGFAGYGVLALSVVLVFVSRFCRPRWLLVAMLGIGGFLGLSFYTAYMRDRTEIRATVWGGERFSARVDRFWKTVSSVEWFDPYDPVHLEFIDGRLNQSALVGGAVVQLANSQDFARGETLLDAVVAIIPRAIWPNKPMKAGSGGLVTRFTGQEFAEGTSVGIGQVLEFYANFGTPGVVIGFLLLGAALGAVDRIALGCLLQGNWQGFTLWFLVGAATLQVGGSLVEITTSAIASVVLAHTANAALYGYQKVFRPGSSIGTHASMAARP